MFCVQHLTLFILFWIYTVCKGSETQGPCKKYLIWFCSEEAQYSIPELEWTIILYKICWQIVRHICVQNRWRNISLLFLILVVLKVAVQVLPGIVRIKNVSVSRSLYIIKNLVPYLVSWNLILYTYISLFMYLFLECMQGFSGENCSSTCPYLTYGRDCQELCNCSKDICDVFTGCQRFTTGYNVLNSTVKAKAQPLRLIQFTYSSMYVASFIKFDIWFW